MCRRATAVAAIGATPITFGIKTAGWLAGVLLWRRGTLRKWLDEVETFWASELDAFKAYAERTRGRKKP